MSHNDDDDLMRRFQALRRTTTIFPDTRSDTSSVSSSFPSAFTGSFLGGEQQQQQTQNTPLQTLFDKIPNNLVWNDRNKNKLTEQIETMKAEDEENLSQEMTELSTSTTNENPCLLKEIQVQLERIPDYLTRNNKSFKDMLRQALSTTTVEFDKTTERTDELRQIAIVIYQIMIIQTYRLLWAAYLKSGTGQLAVRSEKQLTPYPTNISIWSKEIRRIVQSLQTDKAPPKHEMCLNFVNHHLDELDHQLRTYQTELNTRASNFQGYTSAMQRILENYIEDHLRGLRMEIEHRIEIIYYDYHIRAIKLEYLRQNPNTFQEQLMKDISQSKYEQETTEQEYHFLKQQITYYSSSRPSFEYLSASQCSLLNSISDLKIRQQSFQQLKTIAEQSRANLFRAYLKSAEEDRDAYKRKHQTNMEKIWTAYRCSNDNDKISSTMLGLIHQRCQKISERISCVYKFKHQHFLLTAQT